MTTAFLITTYNRHKSLDNLIRSIRAINLKQHIYILDDGSDPAITKYKHRPYVTYQRQNNKGKHLYWQTVNSLFEMVKDKVYDFYFMLPDDVTVGKDFIDKTIDKWNEIGDTNMIALNLITDRVGMPCWTAFTPEDKGHSYLTNWVDMCMCFRKNFFDYIGKIPEINRGWETKPELGSGVGSYISRVIYAKKGRMYQVKESFVTFQDSHNNSVMHDRVAEKAIMERNQRNALKKVYYLAVDNKRDILNKNSDRLAVVYSNGKMKNLYETSIKKDFTGYNYLIKIKTTYGDEIEVHQPQALL